MRVRPVRVYTQTLEFLWEFGSMAEATREAGVTGGNVGVSCRPPYPLYLGMNWRAVDDDELWAQAETGHPDLTRLKQLCKTSRHGAPRCKIQQYTLEGEFIAEYKSAMAAQRAVKGTRSAGITSCCKGVQRQCGGFLWKYANEDSEIRAMKADATSDRYMDGFDGDEIEGELWRPVEGVYGVVYYEVSNFARVRKLGRYDSFNQYHPARLLKQSLDNSGEVTVRLSHGIKGCTRCHVGRLVALAFIPNPLNMPFVRHKDGDMLNNHVDNLEWCTPVDLMIHNGLLGKACQVNSKPVRQYRSNGELVAEYVSAAEGGSKTGISADSIRWCCNRESKSGLAKGYVWRFTFDDDLFELSVEERAEVIRNLWVSRRHRK